jgi:NTP pyrophosphatase (non-canonical NTP hydrolase)
MTALELTDEHLADLRAKAEAAFAAERAPAGRVPPRAEKDFLDAATTSTVLALLDEISRLRAQRENLDSDYAENEAALRQQLARAKELRDGARAQCVRRTAELAEALARLRIADRDAAFGRGVLTLADELVRLRAMMAARPDAFTTDGSPESIAAVLAGELAEVGREQPGSEAAQRECGDVFAASVHLMIAHDACLLAEIDAVVSKIEARLDTMDERGCTWAEAKQAVQLSIN